MSGEDKTDRADAADDAGDRALLVRRNRKRRTGNESRARHAEAEA